MPKSTYTPFTYLIRLVLVRHLVLPESVMRVDVILMTYGLSISLLHTMLLFKGGSMANQM